MFLNFLPGIQLPCRKLKHHRRWPNRTHTQYSGIETKEEVVKSPPNGRASCIKFPSQVDFNLLRGPFRYLDIANACAEHDSHWLSSHLRANK